MFGKGLNLSKQFQVKIWIQSQVMAKRRFHRFVAVSRPSWNRSWPKLNQFFLLYSLYIYPRQEIPWFLRNYKFVENNANFVISQLYWTRLRKISQALQYLLDMLCMVLYTQCTYTPIWSQYINPVQSYYNMWT